MEKSHECKVCLNVYTVARKPRALPCGHTFCEPCLVELRSSGAIECPTCRKRHTGEVRSLMINYDLISDDQTDKASVLVCNTHKLELKYWCSRCQVPACSECHIEVHNGHKFIKIEESEGKKFLNKQQYEKKIPAVIQSLTAYIEVSVETEAKYSTLLTERRQLNDYLRRLLQQILTGEEVIKKSIDSPAEMMTFKKTTSAIDTVKDSLPNIRTLKEQLAVAQTWIQGVQVRCCRVGCTMYIVDET